METVTTEPIRLQETTRYPSYQLYAAAGTQQSDKDEVFKICILHTYAWLRARFSAFNLKELDFPEPEDSDSFSIDSIKNFNLAEPYPIELVCIPEKKIWSIKLTEPDNGSPATEFRPVREPVIGRFFETSVAYRVTENGVECGFRTMISEPKGTEQKADVFRLGCIKKIARDSRAGLYQEFKLVDEPVKIQTASEAKKLARWIKSENRQLPVIVFNPFSVIKGKPFDLPLPAVDPLKPSFQQFAEMKSSALYGKMPEMPKRPDLTKLARYRIGYAQYFEIGEGAKETAAKEFPSECLSNPVFSCEPLAFGGRIRTNYPVFDREQTESRLEKFAVNYPENKPMKFGKVLFVPGAKEIQLEEIIKQSSSTEETVKAYEEKINAINAVHDDELASIQASLHLQIRENERLRKLIDRIQNEIEAEKAAMKERHAEEVSRITSKSEKDREQLERIRTLERRPQDFKLVKDWVANEFEGRMILHERAKGMLDVLKPGEWDINKICDALEYLAVEYRDELIGEITAEERDALSAEKYNRPFTVSPVGLTIENARKEYKIRYGESHRGKPVEKLLDLHLKIGNKNDELLRIYFLYDKEKRLIVVGSLPEHLKIKSFH